MAEEIQARLLSRSGVPVARVWVPGGCRVVVWRGRAFVHYGGADWREASTHVVADDPAGLVRS